MRSASEPSSSMESESRNAAASRGRERALKPDRHFVRYFTEADAQAHQQTHLRQAGFISGSAHRELVMASGESSGRRISQAPERGPRGGAIARLELRRSAGDIRAIATAMVVFQVSNTAFPHVIGPTGRLFLRPNLRACA